MYIKENVVKSCEVGEHHRYVPIDKERFHEK
jgi:hypothetical protein